MVAIQHLGCIAYEDALTLQKNAHRAVLDGENNGTIFLLSHPATISLGKRADTMALRFSVESLKDKGFSIHKSSRGGLATIHSQGQLVCYPVLRVSHVRAFVTMLESVILSFLEHFGLVGHRLQGLPGIYVDHKKIAAIGIRVERRVSYHGFAINCFNDLSFFDAIIPCGETQRLPTSLLELKGDVVPRQMDPLIAILTPILRHYLEKTKNLTCCVDKIND